MKRRNTLLVTAMAGLMATTSLAPLAVSAATASATTDSKTATDSTASYATQKDLLKTADAGIAAVTAVHEARLALFDDQADAAKTKIDAAIKAFGDAENDFKALRVADTDKTKTNANAKADYLPIDVSMMLTDEFTPTEQNKAALKKAGEMMKSGNKNQAVETLRLASVDIDVSAALLPESATMQHLKKASDLIGSEEYFEANRELKAIEDSVVVRTFGLDGIPVQGDHSTAQNQAAPKKGDKTSTAQNQAAPAKSATKPATGNAG